MPRQRRLNERGTYHHITARGVDRCNIFLDDGDRRQFLALLSESHQRFGCRILSFCLMDNHIHLTVIDDQGTLSKTLHFLNGVYAKKFNLRHGRTGHLFERRFWSSVLGSDAYLITCVKYIHRNPFEAGLVRRIADYQWSSYPSYIGERRPPGFLDTTTILSHYHNDLAHFRAATGEQADDELVDQQLGSSDPLPRLGIDRKTAGTNPTGTPVVTPVPILFEAVMQACTHAAGVSVEEILRRRPGRRNEVRDLVAFVSHRHAGHSLSDIAPRLGLTSGAAVSMACTRFSESADDRHKELLSDVLGTLQRAAQTS